MVTASEKLRAYQNEISRKKLKTLIYGSFVLVTTVFLVMLCSGDRFNRYLGFFGITGIDNPEGGVYADCSLEANKDISYCQSRRSIQEQNWQKLQSGGSAPFTLYKNE